MATGDKADLLSSLSNNITDNSANENTPARHRTYASKIITYCLNLVESVKQVVQGPVDFSSQVEFTVQPTFLSNKLITADDLPPTAYCNYMSAPNLTLTTTPQLLTGWSAEEVSVGMSESAGVFTFGESGIYNVVFERIYQNDDQSPSGQIDLTIQVYKNEGAGDVLIFERTGPISSATSANEPAVLSFTTPSNRAINAGTTIKIYASADDNGGNPADTKLIRSTVVANLIHNLPGA